MQVRTAPAIIAPDAPITTSFAPLERSEKLEVAALALLSIRGEDKLPFDTKEVVVKFAKRSLTEAISDDECDDVNTQPLAGKKPRVSAGVFGLALQAPPRMPTKVMPLSRLSDLKALTKKALPAPNQLVKTVVGGRIKPLCYRL